MYSTRLPIPGCAMTDIGLEALVSPAGLAPPRRGRSIRRLFRHRSFVIGFVIIVVRAVAAIFAPLLTPLDPSAMKVRFRFRSPASDFTFGTDMFGRDIFTRVLYGARVSLFVGLAVSVISGFCGAVLGVVAAQFRKLDAPIMRLMDALMSFPAILLALGIAAALGPRVSSVIAALTVAYVPAGVRIVRASALVVRELDYVQAARLPGAGNARIMFRPTLHHSAGTRSRY